MEAVSLGFPVGELESPNSSILRTSSPKKTLNGHPVLLGFIPKILGVSEASWDHRQELFTDLSCNPGQGGAPASQEVKKN